MARAQQLARAALVRSFGSIPVVGLLALGGVLGFASCGGGGGGAATYVLAGRLRLEAESASPSALPALRGLATTLQERAGRDFEPNDHLFSAIDLGEVDAKVFGRRVAQGRVGAALDPRDVLRIGRVVAAEPEHYLDFELRGVSVRASVHVEAGSSQPAFEVLPGERGALRLEVGQDVVIIIESQDGAAHDWELEVAVAEAAVSSFAVMNHVPSAKAQAQREAVHGGVDFRFLAGEVIVDCAAAEARLAAMGFRRLAGKTSVGRYVRDGFVLPADRLEAQRAQSDLLREVRRALPDAAWVSPNIITPLEDALAGASAATLASAAAALQTTEPNDERWKTSEQFNLRLTGFPDAWQTTTGSDAVHIAIVDTGMMTAHPDLAPRVSAFGYDFISDKDSAGDGDGIDDDPSEPQEFDKYFFHGTYVGGVAAAVTNNTIGVAGGTWKGKVLPIRVFGELGGASYDRVQAYRYLSGQPNDSGRILPEAERPRVVNLSFAISVPTMAEHVEIQRLYEQKVHMVAAIDNQGLDPAPLLYPAAWPEVLCCSAVDENLVRTTYSNAADYVDVCALGGTEILGPKGVLTTWAYRIEGKLTYLYATFLGTSVATPSVTAALALMEAVHPKLEPELARRILAETAKDLGPVGKDRFYGHGLLQADLAVRRALELDKAPVLALTPSALRIEDEQTAGKLRIENLGGRLLGDFLLQSIGSASGALSFDVPLHAPGDIVVSVDRDKSLVGNRLESYRLTSNGGSASFDISWRRPIPEPPSVFEVWLSFDGRFIAKTRSAADGSFAFSGLQAGTYFLEAGVDRDQNGMLGDPQEWFLSRKVVVDGATTGELGGVIPWRN
mgnify:CR=1 FL=1